MEDVYAVALQSTGRVGEAVAVLEALVERVPSDPELLYTLVSYSLEDGQRETARNYARKLQALLPGNAEINALVRSLEP